MKTRQELAKATTKRYQKADRKKKAGILDEFCESTQYNRIDGDIILDHLGSRLFILGEAVSHPFYNNAICILLILLLC